LAKKKAREAQNAFEELKVLEDRSNKLVEAIKTLKEENQVLKSGRSVQPGSNFEELEAANPRSLKLEQAVRKLRQKVADLDAEAADKEKAYEQRLKTAEARILAAEERAKNATAFALSTDMTGGPPMPAIAPPPPPPPPTLKLVYEIKINRTGQANLIEGELGKPKNHRNIFVDSIVEAIKKGVTLKKTGLRDYDEEEEIIVTSSAREDDFNVEDAFAAMAREIAINKQKRERNKEQSGDQKCTYLKPHLLI